MRSEEWWKGRTIHKAPQYPFLYTMLLSLAKYGMIPVDVKVTQVA